jgi:hypothetical protein
MGREEQVEEREVLDSIFPDEIQGMSIFCMGWKKSFNGLETL